MSSLYIGLGTLAITAVGAGISAASQMQAGQAAQGIAGQNANIQRANAELDRRASIIQANDQIRAAQTDKLNAGLSLQSGKIDEANARLERVQGDFVAATQVQNLTSDSALSVIDSQISRRNASTLTTYARTLETEGRERISRMRDDGRRAMGIVRNKVAASGIVESGSPLLVEGANAANIELAAQDVDYETRSQSRSSELQAQNELAKSGRSLLQAAQSRKNARTVVKGVKYSRASADFKAATGLLEQQGAKYAMTAADYKADTGTKLIDLANDRYDVALGEAGVTEAGGAATARASQLAAYGTLLSGASDVAGNIATNGKTYGAAFGNSVGTIQYATGTTPKATAV